MAKLKKRIKNKKKMIKKLVKHVNQQVKKKTNEQQAKENEMMKLLLSRQTMTQTPAQLSKENDKYQQQIDTYNKANYELQRKVENKEAEVVRLKQQNEQLKAAERELKNNQKQEQQDQQFADRMEQLQEANDKYKIGTEAYEAHKKINDIVAQTKNVQRELTELELQQKKDQIWKAVKDKEDEKTALQIQLAAQQEVMNSPEWKNRKDLLVERTVEVMLTERKVAEAKEIEKRKEEIMRNEAEIEALKLYEKEITKGKPRQVINKDGTLRFRNGKPVYQKDKDGNIIYFVEDSIIAQHQKDLAAVNKEFIASEIELDKVKGRVNNIINLEKQLNEKQTNLNRMKDEIIADKTFIQSDECKKIIEDVKRKEQMVAASLRKREIEKKEVETIKTMRDIEIAANIEKEFIEDEKDSAAIMTQIQVLGTKGRNLNQATLDANQQAAELKAAQDEYTATYNSIINAFDDGLQGKAKRNLDYIIQAKVDGRLKENMLNNSIENIKKGTEFIKHIDSFNDDILLKENVRDGFIESSDFQDFNWL